MSYDGINNLNELSVSSPLDGASTAELALAIREIKAVLKNVLLQSHLPSGVLRGINSSTLEENSVGSTQLVDRSVTSVKIALLAIITELLADNSVTGAKIAEATIVAANFADDSIPSRAYSPNTIPIVALAQALTGLYISSSASDDTLRAIGSNHLKDGSVTNRAIADVAFGKLSGGTAGQILVRGASGFEAVVPAGGLTYDPLTGLFKVESPATSAYFGDSKSRGISGGSSIAGVWTTRDLGEIEDGRNLMTFVGNSFRLVTGSYFFFARCPTAGAVGKHQARLFRDNGDTTNIIPLWGSSEQGATGCSGFSIVQGTLEVESEDHYYKLEHYCENSVATSGLGLAASSDNAVVYGNHVELYTSGYIIKLV